MAQNYVMLALGGYRFALETSAYQTLNRSTSYKWAVQERFGQRALQQYTGADTDAINLEGIILPHFKGGLGQIALMRAEAETGKPLSLVSGRGEYFGLWTIHSITENTSDFWPNGAPRRIDFTVSLQRYDTNLNIGNFITTVTGLLSSIL